MELTTRYLLDTNAIIYLLNGHLATPLPKGQYSVSIITEIELLSFHALSDKEEQLITDLLQQMDKISLTDEVSRKAINLRRSNKKLKLPDAVIAATAIIKNAILLTNDHIFSAVVGLNTQSLQLLDDSTQY
ncbi:MAG: type II toxin-antitoxin system VapC family toxin [Pelodictyon phaeoclathratiforme]